MASIQVTVPDAVLGSLRKSPFELGDELRLVAAMHWYSRGILSQERAAELAGLDRTDFLLALSREQVEAFVVDIRSLRAELEDDKS